MTHDRSNQVLLSHKKWLTTINGQSIFLSSYLFDSVFISRVSYKNLHTRSSTWKVNSKLWNLIFDVWVYDISETDHRCSEIRELCHTRSCIIVQRNPAIDMQRRHFFEFLQPFWFLGVPVTVVRTRVRGVSSGLKNSRCKFLVNPIMRVRLVLSCAEKLTESGTNWYLSACYLPWSIFACVGHSSSPLITLFRNGWLFCHCRKLVANKRSLLRFLPSARCTCTLSLLLLLALWMMIILKWDDRLSSK